MTITNRTLTVELARELADVDDPGTWVTLPRDERDRYERMALVALTFSDVEDQLQERYEQGFEDGLEAAEEPTA